MGDVMGTSIGAQYDHWDHFRKMLGRDALYVDTNPIDKRIDVWTNLHEAFDSVVLEKPVVTYGHGVQARTIYLARCYNFHKDIFTALKATNRIR